MSDERKKVWREVACFDLTGRGKWEILREKIMEFNGKYAEYVDAGEVEYETYYDNVDESISLVVYIHDFETDYDARVRNKYMSTIIRLRGEK